LPGHADKARLYRSSDGHWRYRCGGWDGGLADVRASIAHGRPVRVDGPDGAQLGRVVVSRWRERLDYEAGLLVRRPVSHELPDGLSSAGLAVARGVLLLLALRDDERWDGPTFTFARRFAIAWCGVTESVARSGLAELREAGFLRNVGQAKDRSSLWQLGEPPKQEDDDEAQSPAGDEDPEDAPYEPPPEEVYGDAEQDGDDFVPATDEQEAECRRLVEKWGAP